MGRRRDEGDEGEDTRRRLPPVALCGAASPPTIGDRWTIKPYLTFTVAEAILLFVS